MLQKTTLNKFLLLPLCALIVFFPLYQAQADGCGESTGANAAFHDFNKVIIYLSKLPPEREQAKEGYPDALKTKNISNRLVERVNGGISGCFKPNIDRKDRVSVQTKITPEIVDPDNLILIAEVSYPEGKVGGTAKDRYGYLYFQFYRPGLSSTDALSVNLKNKSYQVIFPAEGEKALDDAILKFLARIRTTPISEAEFFKRQNSKENLLDALKPK